MTTHTTSAPNALVDLERELSCSICTDILYYPLTLLDCLHTFCGSCLKEWFTSQKLAVERKIRQEGRAPPVVYTCPSCRANVRDTRPNASVTTLLEMYLAANPGKDKTEQEKAELDAIYKRGDSVMPEPPQIPATDTSDEEVDQRMLQEVRQLTIDQMSSSRQDQRRARHEAGRRVRHDDRRSGQGRRSRRNTGESPANTEAMDGYRPPQTALERESSIRSLFSSSSFDSAEMEAEIMQQVVQGGLLDGIDLRNLSAQQEDEIIQRIAEAYRRQQKEKRQRERERSQTRRALAERRPRENGAHPPVSRPYLLETASDGPAQPRPSSRGNNNSSPPLRSSRELRRSSGDRIRPASRSATDLSLRPHSRSRQAEEDNPAPPRRARLQSRSRERRLTDPQARSVVDMWRSGACLPARDGTIRISTTASPQQEEVSMITPEVTNNPARLGDLNANRPLSIPAPNRSCASCGKQNIEHKLHYSCHKCTEDVTKPYTLCQSCYRLGKGCLHWFGFGHAAVARFGRQSPPTNQSEPPHVMQGEKYVHDTAGNAVQQSGKFCDICAAHSDACYWSCDICNDGDWGYCDTCVGQARHCTHSLLATALDGPVGSDPFERKLLSLQVRLPCSLCRKDILFDEKHLHCATCNFGDYDICLPCYQLLMANGSVSENDGLKGWRRCPRGHRMLLVTFIVRTRITSPAIALSERPRTERLVLQGVVGGWSFKESSATPGENNSLPTQWSWRDTESVGGWQTKQRPDHTQAQAQVQASSASEPQQVVQALWTRIPDESAPDELTFPRAAAITEVVNINGDWAWGIFCRSGGLFPANYGRVVEL